MDTSVELAAFGTSDSRTSVFQSRRTVFGGLQSQASWKHTVFCSSRKRMACCGCFIVSAFISGCVWLILAPPAGVPPQGSRPPPRASKDVAVAIRTHSPLPGMLDRFIEIAEDLGKNYPSVHFVISIDTSRPVGKPDWKDCADTVKQQVPEGTLLHVYNWSDVEAKFPGWMSGKPTCTIENPFKDMKVQVGGWNFHAEPISLIYEFLRLKSNLSSDSHIWIVEDDVYFCGGPTAVSQILSHYKEDQHDFLFYPTAFPVRKLIGPNWWQTECCSPGFSQLYPTVKRFQGPEHVHRFSARFLDHLDDLMLNKDAHAWSEMFPLTICYNDPGFHCGLFKKEDVGDYRWNNNFDRKRVEQSCANQAGRTTMNHAAKFFQQLGWRS